MSSTTDPKLSAAPAGIRASDSFFPELESLRGCAILLVFLFHADSAVMGLGRVGTSVSPVKAFMTAGHTGVTLFFVLSAFLLARPFLEEGRGGRRVRRVDFFRRRVLRIMPLYAVAVIVAVLLCLGKPGALLDGLRSLFFLNSVTGLAHSLMPYSAVWWSLATEAQFYIVLPALGLCLRTRLGRAIGVAALLAWTAAYVYVVNDYTLMSLGARLQLSLTLAGRAPAFLFGIAAAWIVSRYGTRLRSAARESIWLRSGGSDLLLLLTLWVLGMFLQEVTSRGFFPAEVGWTEWHLAESGLWTAVVLLVLLAPLRTRALISNRVLSRVGLLSYSLYLIHEPVVHFSLGSMMNGGAPLASDLALRTAVIAAILALCMTFSAITYRLIERPFLLRKARIDR